MVSSRGERSRAEPSGERGKIMADDDCEIAAQWRIINIRRAIDSGRNLLTPRVDGKFVDDVCDNIIIDL